MTSARSMVWAFSLAVALAAAAPARAAAPAPAAQKDARAEGEDEGTAKAKRPSLDDRIRPVSGSLFKKEGRIEVTPGLGMSLGDAFFNKYSFGLKLDYHATEAFRGGVYASYALATVSGTVNKCNAAGVCTPPAIGDLKDVPGKVGFIAGLEVAWAPMYGKLNVLAEKVLHFDLGVGAGVDFIQYMEPGGKDAFTVGGHLGISQHYFLTHNLLFRIELRDYIYSAKTVALGADDSRIEHQFMLEVGLSILIGTPKPD